MIRLQSGQRSDKEAEGIGRHLISISFFALSDRGNHEKSQLGPRFELRLPEYKNSNVY
jgi:hypothetical protein